MFVGEGEILPVATTFHLSQKLIYNLSWLLLRTAFLIIYKLKTFPSGVI